MSPQHACALLGAHDSTTRLPAEFAQRFDELLKMVRVAKTRRLTLGEHQAIATLLESLRALLGPDT